MEPVVLEPLVDLSMYEGMPMASIARLVGIFYNAGTPGNGSAQLDAMEAQLQAGADPSGKDLLYMVHQMAGGSLQAGAARLGKTARDIHSSGTLTPERVAMMRALFATTASELEAQGYL